jgi:hypothetical protein
MAAERRYTPFLHALLLGCPVDLRPSITNYLLLLEDFDAESRSYPAPWTVSAVANLVAWVLKQHGYYGPLDMLERGIVVSVVSIEQAERITSLVVLDRCRELRAMDGARKRSRDRWRW